MTINLTKPAIGDNSIDRLNRLADRWDGVRVELRPGTCNDRRGVCDCLSGTTAPLVNFRARPRFH